MCPEEVCTGRARRIKALSVITVIHFPQASAPPIDLEIAERASLEKTSRFSLSRLTMFANAARELNALFMVCRLFNVLENYAYAMKNDDTGSRRAIKIMLGVEDVAMCRLQVDGHKFTYNRTEIAGRRHDQYFHGSSFHKDGSSRVPNQSFI
jgi:hypothetical protein